MKLKIVNVWKDAMSSNMKLFQINVSSELYMLRHLISGNNQIFSDRLEMSFTFRTSSFHPFVKIFSFTFYDFLSSVGGCMGLLAGISILSVVEIFYHMLAIKFKLKGNKVRPRTQISSKTSKLHEDHVLVQLIKYCGKFIKTSDMHGAHYAMDSSLTTVSRIFWSVLLILSFSTCAIYVSNLIGDSEKNPVAVRIETRTTDEVS